MAKQNQEKMKAYMQNRPTQSSSSQKNVQAEQSLSTSESGSVQSKGNQEKPFVSSLPDSGSLPLSGPAEKASDTNRIQISETSMPKISIAKNTTPVISNKTQSKPIEISNKGVSIVAGRSSILDEKEHKSDVSELGTSVNPKIDIYV
jgi:hypothetical protein